MKTILLRDIPDELHKSIVDRAEKNRRSVRQEMLKILEDVVSQEPKGKTIYKEERRR